MQKRRKVGIGVGFVVFYFPLCGKIFLYPRPFLSQTFQFPLCGIKPKEGTSGNFPPLSQSEFLPCSFSPQPSLAGGLSSAPPGPVSAALGRPGGGFTAEASPFPLAPGTVAVKLPAEPRGFPSRQGEPPQDSRCTCTDTGLCTHTSPAVSMGAGGLRCGAWQSSGALQRVNSIEARDFLGLNKEK